MFGHRRGKFGSGQRRVKLSGKRTHLSKLSGKFHGKLLPETPTGQVPEVARISQVYDRGAHNLRVRLFLIVYY